jgi:hypothetical protein
VPKTCTEQTTLYLHSQLEVTRHQSLTSFVCLAFRLCSSIFASQLVHMVPHAHVQLIQVPCGHNRPHGNHPVHSNGAYGFEGWVASTKNHQKYYYARFEHFPSRLFCPRIRVSSMLYAIGPITLQNPKGVRVWWTVALTARK